jgi:hypothetical protein
MEMLKFCKWDKRVQNLIILLILIGTFSCSILNKKNEIDYSFVDQPKDFFSPLNVLDKSLEKTERNGSLLKKKINFNSKEWFDYTAERQNWETLFYNQKTLEDQLLKEQFVQLESGHGYSFELESFCLDPYKESPYSGDGLKLGTMPKIHQSWMPELLNKYSSRGLSQEEAQILIWALVSDAKFDELSIENQKNLLKIFPEAMIKFGNRRIENLAKDILRDMLPDEITNSIEEIKNIRERFLNLQSDYKALEKIMVQPSKKPEVLFNQWMKFKDGYFVKLTAFGYSTVHVDLYVPKDHEIRSPQGIQEIVFSIKNLIGIPTKGQRIAISPKSKEKKKPQDKCKQLSNYRVSNCHEMTNSDRKKILELADPKNFPTTRYGSPPDPSLPIEQETDCSHFVEEIYKRAGFNYPYTATGEIGCLGRVFNQKSEVDGLPGDLVLYDGHIGILNKEGKVISATRGGRLRRSTKDPGDPEFLPSITINDKDAFGKIKGVLKWNCN